jgi:hypothetical protein
MRGLFRRPWPLPSGRVTAQPGDGVRGRRSAKPGRTLNIELLRGAGQIAAGASTRVSWGLLDLRVGDERVEVGAGRSGPANVRVANPDRAKVCGPAEAAGRDRLGQSSQLDECRRKATRRAGAGRRPVLRSLQHSEKQARQLIELHQVDDGEPGPRSTWAGLVQRIRPLDLPGPGRRTGRNPRRRRRSPRRPRGTGRRGPGSTMGDRCPSTGAPRSRRGCRR